MTRLSIERRTAERLLRVVSCRSGACSPAGGGMPRKNEGGDRRAPLLEMSVQVRSAPWFLTICTTNETICSTDYGIES